MAAGFGGNRPPPRLQVAFRAASMVYRERESSGDHSVMVAQLMVVHLDVSRHRDAAPPHQDVAQRQDDPLKAFQWTA